MRSDARWRQEEKGPWSRPRKAEACFRGVFEVSPHTSVGRWEGKGGRGGDADAGPHMLNN